MRAAQVIDAFSLPVESAATGEAGRPVADADQVRAALQVAVAGLRQRGLAGETLGVSLPATETSYRVLSFPFADERRIAQAVAFAADGEFALPLDQLAFGH